MSPQSTRSSFRQLILAELEIKFAHIGDNLCICCKWVFFKQWVMTLLGLRLFPKGVKGLGRM